MRAACRAACARSIYRLRVGTRKACAPQRRIWTLVFSTPKTYRGDHVGVDVRLHLARLLQPHQSSQSQRLAGAARACVRGGEVEVRLSAIPCPKVFTREGEEEEEEVEEDEVEDEVEEEVEYEVAEEGEKGWVAEAEEEEGEEEEDEVAQTTSLTQDDDGAAQVGHGHLASLDSRRHPNRRSQPRAGVAHPTPSTVASGVPSCVV